MANFVGEIQGGRVLWSDPEGVKAFVAGLENERVSISIEKWRPGRSAAQQRYYRGVVVKILADELGWEPEEMHEHLRQRFLLVEKDGRTFARSTASLNTADFGAFVDRVIRWAAIDLHIVIPDPEGFRGGYGLETGNAQAHRGSRHALGPGDAGTEAASAES